MKKIIILFILITINSLVFSQNIDINIENSYINVGEWTTFTVTASGDIKEIQNSEPEDINFNQIGRSSSYSIINGVKTRSYILNYRVKALKPGTLKLPIFIIENSQGEKIKSEQLLLFVDELKDDVIIEHDINAIFENNNVKLYLDLPKRDIYIGEAVPVEVVAYFLTSYQPGIIRSPYIKTGSFILDNGEKYDNSRPEKIINGQKWIEVVWHSYLTPLKSGDIDLEVVMDSYIEIPNSNTGFFSNSEKKELQTTTKLKTVTIKPIPLANRPKSYSGAIGEFSMNDSISSTEVNVGDPLTLSIDIYGEGNFQRILVPQMEESNNWKLYPESSNFNGTNKSNYHGVKNFQQVLSPNSEEITSLPEFKFSFFNPITGEFSELSTKKYSLNVTPTIFDKKEISNELDKSFNEVKQSIFHTKSKKINVNKGIFKMPLFYVALTLGLLNIIFHISIYTIKKKKNNSAHELRRNQKKIIGVIKSCESNGKFDEALENYRNIIQLTESIVKLKSISSITSTDIDNIKLRKFMEVLDEYKYTNKTVLKDDYIGITKNILKELGW